MNFIFIDYVCIHMYRMDIHTYICEYIYDIYRGTAILTCMLYPIHMYIYICIYMYIYIYMNVYMYEFTYIYMHI
jgi:hypothetical protein